jgi:UDP-glucose 4-epimerase
VGVAVDRVHADLAASSPRALEDLCAGASVLFHLAAEKYNTPGSTSERILDVNVVATNRLFDAAARAGLGKTIFTSSLYAYGALGPEPMREVDAPAPWTTYGTSKLTGEHLLRTLGHACGMRWSVARVFFVYGPRQFAEGGYKSVIVKNFERLRAGEAPVINGDGLQGLDYFYVDDCVDGLLRMVGAESDGQTLNLGSGRAVTIRELTRLMLDASGTEIEARNGAADWTAGTMRWADVTRAAEILGWRAQTELVTGLARTWAS